MKKLYTAVVMLGAVALGAQAEAYRSVAINLANGNKVEINLTDELTAAFTPTNLVVEDGTSTVEVPRKDIRSFTFQESAGIADVTAQAPSQRIEGGAMIFTGLPADSKIEVYTVAGVLIDSAVATGEYRFDLSGVNGALIVNVNGVAYKIAANR